MTISLLVLSILPLQIWMMLSPEKAKKLMSSMLKDENIFYCATFDMLLSLLILSFAGLNFEFKWENTLSFIGLLTFLDGLFLLFLPNLARNFSKFKIEKSFQGMIFFSILVDVALIYIDTKLI